MKNIPRKERGQGQANRFRILHYVISPQRGLAAGYQPRPQVVDRGMTTRYGGQL